MSPFEILWIVQGLVSRLNPRLVFRGRAEKFPETTGGCEQERAGAQRGCGFGWNPAGIRSDRREKRFLLIERIEKLGGLREFWIALAKSFPFGRFKRFFGGNSVEPALLGQFLVIGKIEANQHADPRV